MGKASITDSENDTIMTVPQAAAYFQVGEATIKGLIQSRRIPALKIGGTWLFSRKVLEDWMADVPLDRS